MPLDFNLRAFLERLNAFWINYAISSKNRLYDVLGVFNDITVSLFCVWCQNGQSKTWIPRLVFLLALFWTLGNFLEREKGACPLKMHLGNFVRNLPFIFSDCFFLISSKENKTDALACALYFFIFIDTMLYYDKSVDRYEDYLQEHTKNKSQHSPRL